MSDHEWCRDTARDEAIRAAEDAAAVPSIQHRDLPEVVAALTERVAKIEEAMMSGSTWYPICDIPSPPPPPAPPQPAPVPPAEGLRTERVTPPWQRAKWDEALAIICDGGDWGRGNNFDHGVLGALVIWADKEMDRLTAERDAALRERDAAQSQCEELERAALVDHETIGTLRARVAELEAAPAANAGGEAAVVVPQTVVAGNFAQIHWNTCCRLHRMAMDKAGVRWTQDGAEFAFGSLDVGANPLHTAPAANAGGEANQEPVLYGVLWKDWLEIESHDVRDLHEQAVRLAGEDGTVVPLYAAPQPPRGWLTKEERETLEDAADAAESWGRPSPSAKVIRAILARETPPKVKVPHLDDLEADERPVWQSACEAWIAAIRAAGGEVADE